MLKEIMKKVFKPASAETQEEVMTTETDKANLAIDNTTVAELTANLASVTEAMATLQGSFAELSTKYESAQAALNASEAAQALLATQAATARLEARTSAITASVGTSQLEAMLTATNGMDDAAFDTIIGAMAKSFKAEANSPMFKEVGIAAEVEAVEEDPVKRLAAKLAAQYK
jgi:hypothetical protein